MPGQANPTQLKSAVFFGGMYALVLLALAATEKYVGGEGLYVVAGLSGLTDMDAITLSTARLARDGDPVLLANGWRVIVVAGLANLVFKTGIVGIMGNRRLLHPNPLPLRDPDPRRGASAAALALPPLNQSVGWVEQTVILVGLGRPRTGR